MKINLKQQKERLLNITWLAPSVNGIRNHWESGHSGLQGREDRWERTQQVMKMGRVLMQRNEEEKETCSKVRLDLRGKNDISSGPSGEGF